MSKEKKGVDLSPENQMVLLIDFIDADPKPTLQERKDYINEVLPPREGQEKGEARGFLLNAGAKTSEQQQQMIDLLTEGLSDNDKEQIIETLIQLELKKVIDQQVPGTFMRSASLFKTAIEQPMKWELQKNPELAQRYLKDPIKFLQDYDPPKVIKDCFQKCIDEQRKENNPDYKPSSTMHNLVFACVNGPMIKHFAQRLANAPEGKEKDKCKKEYLDLMNNKAQAVIDSNVVIFGIKDKYDSIVRRGENPLAHVVKSDEVKGYMKALNNLQAKVEPSTNSTQVKKDGEEQTERMKSNLEEFNKMRPSTNPVVVFFKEAGVAIGNFFKKIAKAFNDYFSKPTEVTNTSSQSKGKGGSSSTSNNSDIELQEKKGSTTTRTSTVSSSTTPDGGVTIDHNAIEKLVKDGAHVTEEHRSRAEKMGGVSPVPVNDPELQAKLQARRK